MTAADIWKTSAALPAEVVTPPANPRSCVRANYRGVRLRWNRQIAEVFAITAAGVGALDKTLGGLVIDRLRRLPREGESIDLPGFCGSRLCTSSREKLRHISDYLESCSWCRSLSKSRLPVLALPPALRCMLANGFARLKTAHTRKTSVVNIGIPIPHDRPRAKLPQVISGLRAVLLRQPLRAATVVDLKPARPALALKLLRRHCFWFTLAVVRNPFN